MNVSTATRIGRIESKVFDLDALRHKYELVIHTPKVEDKLRQGCEAQKNLSATIIWNDYTLELSWPLAYPDKASLSLSISHPGQDQIVDVSAVNKAVDIFSSACKGSHSGCALDVLSYAIDILSETSQVSTHHEEDACPSLYVLKYNHLLCGSEHKKEKNMITMAKKTLLSGVCYGTPGLMLLFGADEESVASFLTECRAVGKRGEVVYEGVLQVVLGGDATEGWSRELKIGGRGCVEMSAAEVQKCMGGLEVFRRHVLLLA